MKELIDNGPAWLEDWSRQVGAELKDGLREAPSWIAFARDNGTVYHTYTVTAPDPFVVPYYSFLLERTPKGRQTTLAPGGRTSTPTDAARRSFYAELTAPERRGRPSRVEGPR